MATAIDQLVEDLRSLPPDKQREVADFVALLRQQMLSAEARRKAREKLAGCITPEEAAEWNRVIEENFEQIEEET